MQQHKGKVAGEGKCRGGEREERDWHTFRVHSYANFVSMFLLQRQQWKKHNVPHRPVMMFMGRTMVPSTVSLPSTSAVCSARSFILMLIWAR